MTTAVVPALEPHEIRTDLPTRNARLKWVMVVDTALGAGLLANAAVCMAAAVGNAIPTLLGPGTTDASGTHHPGLPWTGCSILAGDSVTVGEVRAKAMTREGLLVVDMPEQAQTSRVYDEYLAAVASTEAADLTYYAVSIVGPRNKVDKLVGKLSLLR
ncbi:DUF2000 domain-containing protein [Umezawaea endophytica]|uniref:DUF2000 domain-containing protein n=1 Tax=Umezawaea endophytica TaxID=1654476 RepID=A0A9X2VJM1_9PSEU|nr:DUF2000 domain-containing protein [Umezawaea endophytica]MCS7477324.1 DUF2000 domain-containing protein [Umezawaea endophytica]